MDADGYSTSEDWERLAERARAACRECQADDFDVEIDGGDVVLSHHWSDIGVRLGEVELIDFWFRASGSAPRHMREMVENCEKLNAILAKLYSSGTD